MTVWAFYGRVSGQEQAENYSLPTQREACHEKAVACGATHVLDFIDAGVPGDLDWIDRPALSQLLDLAEERAIAGVVVYDPDRLARDLGVQLAITELLAKRHIRLEFCTQEYNASPEGVLFYQLRGAISQFERAKIRERTQRGRKKSLRSGIPTNTITTFGLAYDRPTNTWSINEAEAAIIRQIFTWRAAGLGSRSIADRLNQAGIAAPHGGQGWWTATIRRMLQNTAYIGQFHLHRVCAEGSHKNKFLPPERRVKQRIRPREDWVPVSVPAIITEEEWDDAQAAMQRSRELRAGRTSTEVSLAARLIRCGECGSPMHACRSHRGKGRYDRYYRCNGKYGEMKLGCNMPHLPADELDAALWQAITRWVTNPEAYRAAVAQVLRQEGMDAKREEAQSKIAEIRGDISRLEHLVQTGAVKEAEVRPALRSLRDREASLAAAVAREETQGGELHIHDALPLKDLDEFDAGERQEFVRDLVAEIVAHVDSRLDVVPRRTLPKRRK